MRPPRGSGSRRGAHGGGAGRGGFRNEGPPKQVVEVSTFLHACEGDAVTKLTQEKIPYFNLSGGVKPEHGTAQELLLIEQLPEPHCSIFSQTLGLSYTQGERVPLLLDTPFSSIPYL